MNKLALLIIVSTLLAFNAQANASDWSQMPGEARDIGVGANGSVWVIGKDKRGGGFGIHEWAGNRWYRVVGGATRIDVAPDGKPWVVNSSNKIYRWNGRAWQQMPGAARDIGIGANGSVWVIGTDKRSGGYGIYRWAGSTWKRVGGGAVRIDVDSRGNPWVVNSSGKIYKWNGSSWTKMPGAARDISVGGNLVWTIGRNASGGGYEIRNWKPDQKGWLTVSGGATQISADGRGKPWVVNSSGKIYRRK